MLRLSERFFARNDIPLVLCVILREKNKGSNSQAEGLASVFLSSTDILLIVEQIPGLIDFAKGLTEVSGLKVF